MCYSGNIFRRETCNTERVSGTYAIKRKRREQHRAESRGDVSMSFSNFFVYFAPRKFPLDISLKGEFLYKISYYFRTSLYSVAGGCIW